MSTLGPAIPALPVRSIVQSVAFYRDRLRFTIPYQDEGFAIARRDAAEVHLWEASDESWHTRDDLAVAPVRSGAESFISGTASCRIIVDHIDRVFAEMREAGVLHSTSTEVRATDHGTREFAVLDADGNLITFYAPSVVPR